MLSDDEIKREGRDAFGIDPIFDGNLMRFARAVERAAYERAAQECDKHEAHWWDLYVSEDGTQYEHGRSDGAVDCAEAIRALGRQHD